MKTLYKFIAELNGKTGIGNTDGNKGQCVGLVMVWIDNLGLSHFYGHARDLFANAPVKQWKKIKNTPTGYPISGDIIVFDKTMGGGFGHTGVVIESDEKSDSVTIFEQNNPANVPGVACEVTTYKGAYWKAVVGWLRPLK